MAYTNNNGQVRIGVRSSITNSPIIQPAFSASLLQSLYGVWNGDTTTNELSTSIFGAWNGESLENLTSLETSLFSSYNGESNTNDSFGANNGTAQGSLTYTTGKVGNAFSFNGTNAYVSLPNNSLNFIGDFSVSFWVNPTSGIYTWKSIISNYKAGGSFGYGYAIGINEYYDKLQIVIRNNNQITQQWFDYQFTANTWHHVVISRKASNYTKCYINGTLVSGYYPVGGQNDPTFNPAYISNQIANIGGGNNTAGFNGKLDSVNIWTKELTQTEATQLYNSGMGIEYPFVGKLLSSPKDSVGTNHGTLMNGCTYTTGKIGNAFTFDGVNDYMELPANSMNLTGDLTISFWAYMRTRDYNNIICNMDNNGVNRGFYIDSDGSYALRFVGYNSTYTLVKTDNSALFDLNVWNHFTFILKNGVGQWYKNGIANGSSGTIVYSLISGNKPIIGGYRTGNNGSVTSNKNMALDAFTIWNKAISQDEITQLYNSGTGTQYPFVGTFSSAGNQLGMDNGTLMNGCSLTTGKIGQAFTFDGVNDYVALPDNSLNFTGDFSFSFWIYNDNMSLGVNRRYIGSSYYSGSGTYGFGWTLLRRPDNNYYFQLFNGDSNPNSLFSSNMDLITINEWTHIVVTRKRSTQTKIYKNGVDVTSNFSYTLGSNTIDCGYNSTQYCTIGALKDNNTSTFGYIKGKMDSVLVYQKELTQSEITELYNSGNGKQITATPIVQSGLVLNLDASRSSSYTGTGTTWTDISGNGNQGTLANGPVFGTASGGQITFDGINDNFFRPAINVGTTFTVQTWVKISKFGGGNPWTRAGIIANGYSWSSNQGFTIEATSQNNQNNFLPTPGKECFFFSMGSDQYVATSAYGTLTNYVNNWVNIAVVVNNTNPIKLYINGTETTYMGQGNGPSSGSMTYPGTLYVGARLDSNEYMQGSLGDMKMYNISLSDSQILQNFNATKSRFGY